MKPVIDWGKAPKGTTHKGTREFGHVWYRYLDGKWSYIYCDEYGIPTQTIWLNISEYPVHLPLIARDDYVAPPIQGQGSIVDKLMNELNLPPYQGFRELLEELHKQGYLKP